MDAAGGHLKMHSVVHRCPLLPAVEDGCRSDPFLTMRVLASSLLPPGTSITGADAVLAYANLLRSQPGILAQAFAGEVPKSRIASTWDPHVYAGCLERLEDRDNYFLWKDLHWDLDKTELLRRTRQWNRALEKYCDDAGLEGEARDKLVSTHAASPLAPCARVGCDAFETDVRDFRRFSRCKRIAYCSRDCQTLDWGAEHRKECVSHDETLAHRSSFAGTSSHVVVHNASKPLK